MKSDKLNRSIPFTQDIKESAATYTCAYWSESGTWSPNGCHEESTNLTHTVCNCSHLSSFAVLMALTPMEVSVNLNLVEKPQPSQKRIKRPSGSSPPQHTFGLQLVTKIGLAVSLLCLVLSILTFKFCRSIQGTRTTIHLHLCISLFFADLFFLAGISQTSPVVRSGVKQPAAFSKAVEVLFWTDSPKG